MFEDYQICPYTGLRSFSEEESLYFKGREEHIEEATNQLQRNKFLMLTGASGDGKSSLVYAGIIPNARAGFLKSKYSQWSVADFRPERSPFKNLCKAVAGQLSIENAKTVESELHHGFSALVDLYKNSNRFIDVESVAWQQADDKGKAALKRDASNLVIIVDQFEEFFTNPENYKKGVPSRGANLVLNLLLETARIALEEDLPIYVIFTMRSDFIGQCAAFRGLPEYIGFSQFFVPRLNRVQLQQVIEEPASLSGNRITRRLSERLIHDITEGVDQLPILQHALNQIWHAADSGKEEMDLIHYAMVGGMSVKELPEEQVSIFNKWFEELPSLIKACYHEPSLQNVLDTHTNKLFEEGARYYAEKTGKTISDDDAKVIITTAFTCLTKIDQSRAVRNRMTLQEITNILGHPEFDVEVVGSVLNTFREPGNTFIHPFITDNPESNNLSPNQVLDITHESLIRNWNYLEEWADEEYHNYTISLDFEQQLNRWVESDYSGGFLLSIGPLTYFENWFNKIKPNAWWIARYLPEEVTLEKKLSRAKNTLDNANEFLRRSARKHVITRTVMQYGPKRIAAVLGILAIVVLSSFAVRDYMHRQNDFVIAAIEQQTFDLANKEKLSLAFTIPVINEQLMLGNLTIPEVMEKVESLPQKIRIANGIATQLVLQGRNEPGKEIIQSLSIADSLLDELKISDNPKELSAGLMMIFDYEITAGFAELFINNETVKSLVKNNANRSANWARAVLKLQPDGFSDIQSLNFALENAVSNKVLSKDDIQEILDVLSPFENKEAPVFVSTNYQKDKFLERGSYGFKFNGLYQQLAYLYAAIGKTDRVLQCVDTLLQYNETYYQNDYETVVDNATNIAEMFRVYDQLAALDKFVSGYCTKKGIASVTFYNRLVSRILINWNFTFTTNFYSGGGGRELDNPNLKFTSDEAISFFYSRLQTEIGKLRNLDERNFNSATAYKNEGLIISYRAEIRNDKSKVKVIADRFDKAFTSYNKVADNYLQTQISTIGISGADLISMPRKFLFGYPDYRVAFHPFEPRTILQFYQSPSFINYLIDNGLFDQLYSSETDLKYFEFWLTDYHVEMASKNIFLHDPINFVLLEKIANAIEKRSTGKSVNLNILYLHLGDMAFANGEEKKGILFLKKIKVENLLNSFQYKNLNFGNNYSLVLVSRAVAHLYANKENETARKLINAFKKEVNRSSIYGYASQVIGKSRNNLDVARVLVDSAKIEMKKIENPSDFQPNRHQVAMALMYLDPVNNLNEAYTVIKNSEAKFAAQFRFSEAFSLNEDVYKAQSQMPVQIAAGDRSGFLWYTMRGLRSDALPDHWRKFRSNEMIFATIFLPYVNESE